MTPIVCTGKPGPCPVPHNIWLVRSRTDRRPAWASLHAQLTPAVSTYTGATGDVAELKDAA